MAYWDGVGDPLAPYAKPTLETGTHVVQLQDFSICANGETCNSDAAFSPGDAYLSAYSYSYPSGMCRSSNENYWSTDTRQCDSLNGATVPNYAFYQMTCEPSDNVTVTVHKDKYCKTPFELQGPVTYAPGACTSPVQYGSYERRFQCKAITDTYPERVAVTFVPPSPSPSPSPSPASLASLMGATGSAATSPAPTVVTLLLVGILSMLL